MESVKIRSPAGVAPQGHLWWSVVPVGSNAWVRGLPGYGQVSQECFRKILCHTWGSRSFIWKAALRLLTTSSNWTIFSHLSVGQLHWLSCTSVWTERLRQPKFQTHFSLFYSVCVFFVFFFFCPHSWKGFQCWYYLSVHVGFLLWSVNGDNCLWHVAKHCLWHFGGPCAAGGFSIAFNVAVGENI